MFSSKVLLAGSNGPKDILVIGQSSGTTGEAKFFPLTAENAIKRVNPKYLLDASPIPVVASMFHVLQAASKDPLNALSDVKVVYFCTITNDIATAKIRLGECCGQCSLYA